MVRKRKAKQECKEWGGGLAKVKNALEDFVIGLGWSSGVVDSKLVVYQVSEKMQSDERLKSHTSHS